MTSPEPPLDYQRLLKLQEEGDRLRKAGNLRQAIELYESVAESDPKWGNGWIFLTMGDLYEALGDTDRADASFEKSLLYNTDPPNPLYRLNYGTFVLDQGKADAALEILFKALELAAEQGAFSVVEQVRARIAEAAPRSKLSPTTIGERIDRILKGSEPAS